MYFWSFLRNKGPIRQEFGMFDGRHPSIKDEFLAAVSSRNWNFTDKDIEILTDTLALNDLEWYHVFLYGILWLCMVFFYFLRFWLLWFGQRKYSLVHIVLYSLLLSIMVFYYLRCHLHSLKALYGLVCSCMIFYGLLCFCMVMERFWPNKF